MSVDHTRAGASGAIAHAGAPFNAPFVPDATDLRPHAAIGARGMNAALSSRTQERDKRWSTWMAAAQAGDRIAYESLLRSCIPLIKQVARRRGISPDCIDDIVQETLLAVHRARQSYNPCRSFTAWLRTIAQRRAIDVLRRGRRSSAYEIHAPLAYENHADGSNNSKSIAFEFDRMALLGAVRKLPVRQRDAVNQLVFQNHSILNAAAATGRTAGSLRVSWHRAIATLRSQNQTEMAAVKRLPLSEQGRQC